MYVCLCHAVTDAHIQLEVSRGARRMCDLRRRLSLCSQCGKCGQHARQVLQAATAELVEEQTNPLPVAAPA
jgi:bacterioferritin-associated ferredoxin